MKHTALLTACAVLAGLLGCEPREFNSAGVRRLLDAAPQAVRDRLLQENSVVSVEPWSDDYGDGLEIRTEHYRISPTLVDPPILLAGSAVASVYARLKQTINPGDTEDVFLAVMTLADSTVVQAEYTVGVDNLPDWYIQGTRGTITVRGRDVTVQQQTPARPDDPTQFKTMTAAGARTITLQLDADRFGDETQIYREVAQALAGERAYAVAPEDALELSRVLDAIRRSDADNQVVALD